MPDETELTQAIEISGTGTLVHGKTVSATIQLSKPVEVTTEGRLVHRVHLLSNDEAYDILQREIDELRIQVEGLLVFESRSKFPDPGESTSLYIATDESKIYYWDGADYVALTIDLSNYYTKDEVDAFIDWLDARITALEEMHADAYILDCGNAFTNIPDPD